MTGEIVKSHIKTGISACYIENFQYLFLNIRNSLRHIHKRELQFCTYFLIWVRITFTVPDTIRHTHTHLLISYNFFILLK